MGSQSKGEEVLRLILENSPFREWHFEEITRKTNVTNKVANKWIKKYTREGLLKRIKKKGRFPYYIVGSNNPVYYSLKRIYALEQLHNSGLIPKLLSLKNAKTVILFGSLIRGDWYNDSDIDIFIYGNADNFDKNLYELRLNKHIELHIFENRGEIQEVKTGLMKNIINGYIIKGQIQDVAEVA